MKLLFDENLSPKLVAKLADLFPDSNHVEHVGFGSADDRSVWEYAQNNDFIIVTKDSDYNDLSVIHGFPPYVVWIRRGNCTTENIAEIIRQNAQGILDFTKSGKYGIMILY